MADRSIETIFEALLTFEVYASVAPPVEKGRPFHIIGMLSTVCCRAARRCKPEHYCLVVHGRHQCWAIHMNISSFLFASVPRNTSEGTEDVITTVVMIVD